MWLKKGLALAYKFINHVNHIVRHVESGGGGGGLIRPLPNRNAKVVDIPIFLTIAELSWFYKFACDFLQNHVCAKKVLVNAKSKVDKY